MRRKSLLRVTVRPWIGGYGKVIKVWNNCPQERDWVRWPRTQKLVDAVTRSEKHKFNKFPMSIS